MSEPEAQIAPCRRCLKRKPIAAIYVSKNEYYRLEVCAECDAHMEKVERGET